MKRFGLWLQAKGRELREEPEAGKGALIASIILMGIGFIVVGISMQFGPTMLEGFEAMRTASNVSEYTALEPVIEFGPTMILLGFIVAVGVVGYLGIKMSRR